MPIWWAIFAVVGFVAFPLLIHFTQTKMLNLLSLPPSAMLAFQVAEIGTPVGMIFLFIASFETLRLNPARVMFRTIYGKKEIAWDDVISYDINPNAGCIDIVGSGGESIHVELMFFQNDALDGLKRYLGGTRERAFASVDERGLECTSKAGAGGAILLAVILGGALVGLYFLGKSNPPKDLLSEVCYYGAIAATVGYGIFAIFALATSASVNVSGVSQKTLFGSKFIPFGQILKIDLYVKTRHSYGRGADRTYYTETMLIEGMKTRIQVTDGLGGYMLLRDYVLKHVSQATVDDRRPQNWLER